MIKHYIIDGNNLLGKMAGHKRFSSSNGRDNRPRLALILDRYFANKKVSVTLNFDGHKKESIKTNKVKIVYSGNRIADDWIKHEIMVVKNPKTICVVTSDLNILEFARMNSCKTIKSGKFAADLVRTKKTSSEEEAIKSIDQDEIKKLFGIN